MRGEGAECVVLPGDTLVAEGENSAVAVDDGTPLAANLFQAVLRLPGKALEDLHEQLVGEPGDGGAGPPGLLRAGHPLATAWLRERRCYDVSLVIKRGTLLG